MAEAMTRQPTDKEIRLVIGASSAGTIFEWYDFFIYGTPAYILKDALYDVDDPTLGLLLVLERRYLVAGPRGHRDLRDGLDEQA